MRRDDGTYECSCGAVYTLETLPDTCTGTREGRPCTVRHFGDWERANRRIADLALPKPPKPLETKREEMKALDRIMYGDQNKGCALPFYGKPKWLSAVEEENEKARIARINEELRASAERGHPELEKLAEEIKNMPKKPILGPEDELA